MKHYTFSEYARNVFLLLEYARNVFFLGEYIRAVVFASIGSHQSVKWLLLSCNGFESTTVRHFFCWNAEIRAAKDELGTREPLSYSHANRKSLTRSLKDCRRNMRSFLFFSTCYSRAKGAFPRLHYVWRLSQASLIF